VAEGSLVKLGKIENLLIIYIGIILVSFFCILAPQVFITESELWSISLGCHFWSDLTGDWVFTRPLFYFLLWLVQVPSGDPSFAVFSTRILFAFNGLVIAYLLVKISENVTKDPRSGYLSIVLLFGNTGFLSQGFRVRADLLSATLALIALLWLLEQKSFSFKKFWCFILPLLATPKGVVHIIPLFVAGRKQVLSFFKKPVFLGLAFLSFAIWVFINWSNLMFVSHYFERSFGPDYFDPDSWHHIDFQLRRNPHFWILFLLSLIPFGKSSDKRQKYSYFSAAAFGVMLLAPGKSLFFIASFLPFFSLQIGLFLKDLNQKMFWNNIKRISAVVATTLSLLTGIYWSVTNLEKNNNNEQLRVLSDIYNVLKDFPEITYFDGTCLIPSLCTYRYFIGPNQPEANDNAYSMLEFKAPSIIFYIEKSQYLEPKLSNFLEKNYADLGHGLFVHMPHSENGVEKENYRAYSRIRASLPNRMDSLFGYDLNY
jgi:hypothetical protein